MHYCPYVALVCWHPHSHKDPQPFKTPQTILSLFNELLESLDWRLADATPCCIILDSAFMTGLQKILGWVGICDPTLGDLHPSLGNADHAAWLINILRDKHYPYGTGFEGAHSLLSKHPTLPHGEAYVRCVKKHVIPKEKTFFLVICMFATMSNLLLVTKCPSIDTSFKRLHNWQELEIEAWFPEYSRSIVVACAFITSQSPAAHHILFRHIFEVVEGDTGQCIQFWHIHGVGIDSIMADGAKGQALCLGHYCVEISQHISGYSLHTLMAYEHLAWCYHYCFAHFTRHVSHMCGVVEGKARAAIMSIASAEPLPDFQGTLQVIRNGGKKASEWLKNKEAAEGFALATLYRPVSKIPLDVWRASPITSNGNEQAHWNINHDGVKLTLLAGIIRGIQYDSCAMANIELFCLHGIHMRDQQSTHHHRAARSIFEVVSTYPYKN
ncbi:hypothetical protein BU17DRAFT_40561 [Hysterangium stoloniferum]|nr:hypothetical protein BU17DRAFT_40561 [Hysterangium stoloniferum]